MSSQRVTIRDVAREAGVSPTTVSHVLSGQGRVNADTRDLVEQIVHKLGYRANPLARNLRQDRFGSIGLYLPEDSLSFQFYVDMAMSASTTAFGSNCSLTLLPPIEQAVDLLKLPLDGVIVAEPKVDDPVVAALHEARVPIVLCEMSTEPVGRNIHVIDNGHSETTSKLLDHLISQGAQTIAMVAPDESIWWGRHLRTAAQAWEATNEFSIRWLTVPFPCPPEDARKRIEDLLDEDVPDALIVAQQGLGSATMAAAIERGLSVPKDLMIACCSDGPDLLVTSPSITAIDLRPKDCGRIAAEILLAGSGKRTWELASKLHLRESTNRGQHQNGPSAT